MLSPLTQYSIFSLSEMVPFVTIWQEKGMNILLDAVASRLQHAAQRELNWYSKEIQSVYGEVAWCCELTVAIYIRYKLNISSELKAEEDAEKDASLEFGSVILGLAKRWTWGRSLDFSFGMLFATICTEISWNMYIYLHIIYIQSLKNNIP